MTGRCPSNSASQRSDASPVRAARGGPRCAGDGDVGLRRRRGRARHRQDPHARLAAAQCRGSRLPRAGRLRNRVRTRPAVQRLGRCARCIRRLTGASPSTRRGVSNWWTSSPRSSLPVRPRGDGAHRSVADERYRAHRAVRRLLELPRGRAAAGRRARRPALERRGFHRAARCAAAPGGGCSGPAGSRLPPRTGAGTPLGSAGSDIGATDRPRAAHRDPGDPAPGRARSSRGRGHLPARWRQPLLPRALSRSHDDRRSTAALDASGTETAVAGVPVPAAVAESLAEGGRITADGGTRAASGGRSRR